MSHNKPVFGTPLFTPELVAKLQGHETHDNPDDEASSPHLSVPLTPELASKLNHLEDLERREAALAVERNKLNRRIQMQSLLKRCTTLKIGGRDGIHPSSLDIEIEESDPIDGIPTYIAWVPCPVWPIPLPIEGPRGTYTFPSKNGEPGRTIQNYDMGKCSIVESLSTVTVATGKMSPLGMIHRTVGLKAFVSLSLNTLTPEEIESRISRRECKSLHETLTPEADNDFDTDGAISGMDSDTPAFIPSSTSTIRESRPDSPSAPFDTDGNSR